MFAKYFAYSVLGLLIGSHSVLATPLTLSFAGKIYESSDSSWIGQTFTGTINFDPINPVGTDQPIIQSSSNSTSLHSVGSTPNWMILGTPWLYTTLNLPGGIVFQTLSSFNNLENQTVSLITPNGTQQLYIADATSFNTYLNTPPYSIYETHSFSLSAVYFGSQNIGTPFADGLNLSSIDLRNATGSGDIDIYEINVGNAGFRQITARYLLTPQNVPEPGSVALIGVGLIFLGISSWRRD